MVTSARTKQRGKSYHVYLEKAQETILEAIAIEKGRGRTGIKPHRSQLIVKAIENFVEDCRQEPALKGVIEEAERRLLCEKRRDGRAKTRGSRRGLEVVSTGA